MSHYNCTVCLAVVGEARYYYTDLCPECEQAERNRKEPEYRCDACESPLSARDFITDHCSVCEAATLNKKPRSAFEVYEAINNLPCIDDAEGPLPVANDDARRALRVFERDANDAYAWRLSAAPEVQRAAYDAESKWAIGVLRKLVSEKAGEP